jgi:hypothetical protein
MKNAHSTLAWNPQCVQIVHTDAEAVAVIEEAIRKKKSLVTVSRFMWSWGHQLAQNGAIYVRVSDSHVKIVGSSVETGAAALVSEVHLALTHANMQMSAHGACFTSRQCQSIGGVLATNVHHSGTSTFADSCEWVDVATDVGKAIVIRAMKGSDLFRATVGGVGRTGIVVRASFKTETRSYFYTDFAPRKAMNTMRRKKDMCSEMEAIVSRYEGVAPNTLVSTTVVHPFFAVGETNAWVTSDRDRKKDLVAVFGKEKLVWKYLAEPLNTIMYELPHVMYQAWFFVLMGVAFLFLTDVPCDEKDQICMDFACSMDIGTWITHYTWEAYVPTDIAAEFGRFYDAYVKESSTVLRHCVVNLRFVYGSDTFFAGNSPARYNYICVGIVAYHRPSFRHYRTNFENMTKELNERFPGRIRLHPGKVNPPGYTYPEEKAAKFDRHKVFKPRRYSSSNDTMRRMPPLCFPFLTVVALVSALVLLV